MIAKAWAGDGDGGMGVNSVCSREVLSRRNDSRGGEKRREERRGEKARDPRPRRGKRHVFFSTVVCTHETEWWWWSSVLSQVLLRVMSRRYLGSLRTEDGVAGTGLWSREGN